MDWNVRYDREDYLFGTEPADALARHSPLIPDKSRVLCVADGEGRNSVYLAGLGHDVTAFDPSVNAVVKAQALAVERGVTVSFEIADTTGFAWPRDTYDAVVGVFVQFASPPERAELFARMSEAVKPGGLLLLHGYAPRQVDYGTGGPPFSDNMYTLALLRDAFAGWPILVEADYDAEITEGTGHDGVSALIDFIVRRPDGAAG